MFKNKIAKAASLFIALSMLLASCTFETPAVPEKKSIVVLDTDVGLDDAAAMMLLFKRSEIKPDYIITSNSGTSDETTLKNAVLLKKYFGGEGSVIVEGLPSNIRGSGVIDTFNGEDGLANIADRMKESLAVTEEEFSDVMSFNNFCKEAAKADDITYIAIGPLSNLAELTQVKQVKKKISNAYVVGGGIKEFDSDRNSEFNFSKNPKAVLKVLKSSIKITLFPLDLTNHQALDESEINALESIGTYPECITFLRFCLSSNAAYDNVNKAVLHDCMPALYFMHPDKFTVTEMKIMADEYGAIKENSTGFKVSVATAVPETLLKDELTAAFKE